MKKTVLIIGIISLLAAGCSNTRYPVIDPRGSYSGNMRYPVGNQGYPTGSQGYPAVNQNQGYPNQMGYQSAYQVEQDRRECSQYAEEASGGTGTSMLQSGGLGALGGGATGAAIGAIFGDPAVGAALGAAVGAAGGAGYGAINSNNTYDIAMSRCMRGRGHNPLN